MQGDDDAVEVEEGVAEVGEGDGVVGRGEARGQVLGCV